MVNTFVIFFQIVYNLISTESWHISKYTNNLVQLLWNTNRKSDTVCHVVGDIE